jgi:hypothetical protein
MGMRDPDRIRLELASLVQVDTTHREQIERTRRTITTKRAEIQTLEYHVDILLCSMERRHMAMDELLDELNAAERREKESV